MEILDTLDPGLNVLLQATDFNSKDLTAAILQAQMWIGISCR